MKFEIAKEEDANTLIFALEPGPAGVRLKVRNKVRGDSVTFAWISEKGIMLFPVDGMGIATWEGKIKVIS